MDKFNEKQKRKQPDKALSKNELSQATQTNTMHSSATQNERIPVMKPKKSFASSSSAIRRSQSASGSVQHPDGAIEIHVTPTQTFDVRLLSVAIQYSYMFGNPLGDLSIQSQWSAAFRLTCLEIDTFLSENKRGFHWRQLGIEDGVPHWYWSLGKDYDHQVLVFDHDTGPKVVMAKSAADPGDELRNGIRAIVAKGMRRATFFNREASNSGELQ